MEALLLSLHVVAGILFVGPVAAAISLFPRYAPVIEGAPQRHPGERSPRAAAILHRISRVYGLIAVAVPLVGIALAIVQQRMGEIWIIVAMALTAVAGALLALQIVPRQREALRTPDGGAQLRRLGMLAGIFNLLWLIVVVLMIVRPGSAYSS